jgi:preprotein translocase subunit Sss1
MKTGNRWIKFRFWATFALLVVLGLFLLGVFGFMLYVFAQYLLGYSR